MKQLRIGLFGLGVVGQGVVEQLRQNQGEIQARTGMDIHIVKAVTKNPAKPRKVDLSGIALSADPDFILADPDIDLVIELIGGLDQAQALVQKAFAQGKSVVTANKHLLAERAETVFSSQAQSKGLFGYEAAVAGGIPVLRNLREGFAGEKITHIAGIINGTANYILTQMSKAKKDYQTALAEAQAAGYAEADPTFDVEGIDAAHKLLILMMLGFNAKFSFQDLYVEGITGIEPIDIEVAEEFGYEIKLLGKAIDHGTQVEGRVHPCLVLQDEMLAWVQGAYNAVEVKGNFVGSNLAYGRGAGSHPTASAVVADVIAIARQLDKAGQEVVPPMNLPWASLQPKAILPMAEVECPYYLRFTVADQVGVLATITKVLGEQGISIGSMLQKGRDKALGVPVVIFTHKAAEKAIRASLNKIDQMDFIKKPTKLIRLHEA